MSRRKQARPIRVQDEEPTIATEIQGAVLKLKEINSLIQNIQNTAAIQNGELINNFILYDFHNPFSNCVVFNCFPSCVT